MLVLFQDFSLKLLLWFEPSRLLKQKRKRLSTWQLIARQVAYLNSFADVDHFVREELVQAGSA